MVRVIQKKSDETDRALGIALIAFSALLLVTGPLSWFTYLLWPWLILLIARAVITFTSPAVRRIAWGLLGLVFLVELLVAWNTIYRVNSWGQERITYLPVWTAHAQWGYQELEAEIAQRLRVLYPGGTFPVRYPFLEEVRQKYIDNAKADGLKPATLLLVYDSTMQQNALLWTYFRRSTYEGWPVLDVDTYRQTQQEQGEDVFWRQGFKGVIFVRTDPASGTLVRDDDERTDGGQMLEQKLRAHGIIPARIIVSPKTGREASRVYELEPIEPASVS